jgi:hypothetical protein
MKPKSIPDTLRGVTLDATQFPILVVDDEPDNLDAFRFNFSACSPFIPRAQATKPSRF